MILCHISLFTYILSWPFWLVLTRVSHNGIIAVDTHSVSSLQRNGNGTYVSKNWLHLCLKYSSLFFCNLSVIIDWEIKLVLKNSIKIISFAPYLLHNLSKILSRYFDFFLLLRIIHQSRSQTLQKHRKMLMHSQFSHMYIIITYFSFDE